MFLGVEMKVLMRVLFELLVGLSGISDVGIYCNIRVLPPRVFSAPG